MKACPSCTKKFKAAGRRGGLSGDRADKVRASRLAAVARAENALRLTHRGNTLTVAQWAEATGISKRTLWRRIRQHLAVEQILNITNNHQNTKTNEPKPNL